MYFYLSKLLYFLITPIIWIISLYIWAIFISNKSLQKKVIIFTTIFFYISSNQFIINEIIRKWEIQTISIQSIQKPYDYGIVLGGFNTYDVKFDRINFNKASDRLWHAIYLYKQGKIKKLVISGGEGRIIKENYSESKVTKDFLIQLGIPATDIVIETESRNTYENAEFCAKILKNEIKSKQFLLITSAIHMKRANACFRKAGIKCTMFSTDRISGNRKYVFDYLCIPEFSASENLRIYIREVFGYYMYKIMGYI